MIVDHEKAWLKLKAHLSTKRSHGQDELFRVMAGIEVECVLPEQEAGYDDRPLPERSRSSDKPATASPV